jgi:hypothetical protein
MQIAGHFWPNYRALECRLGMIYGTSRLFTSPINVLGLFSSKEVGCFSVGAASCRDGIVAGSHSHKGNTSLPTGWRNAP